MANIVEFPTPEISAEERIRKQMAETQRLASLAPGEYLHWAPESAKSLGIPVEQLIAAVKAILAKREKDAQAAKIDAQRAQRRTEKKQTDTQREREREQKRIEKEAAQRAEELLKAFKKLVELPSKEQEARLAELAKRLDEDIETIRAEFELFVGPVETRDIGEEPWADPVDIRTLLPELIARVREFVAMGDDAALAVSLWTAMAWVHNEIATHSPLLVATSAEPDSGKTTLLGVLGLLTPRPYPVVELTGPNLFHVVDRRQPTLLIDEADKLFHRKTDLAHIMNAGWTRGAKIPRLIHGALREFNVFCPKVVGMLGLSLPPALITRSIIVKLWPRKPDETISDFSFADDDTFLTLRRKLARWGADNAAALKAAEPLFPADFKNRLRANWKLLFAIAEGAGWRKQTHKVAARLSPRARTGSEGVRLLAALRKMFGCSDRPLTSAEIVQRLIADPDEEWAEFRGRSPITQRQVASLLSAFDILPGVIHPTRRSSLSRRGYRPSQFADAFARFLSRDPNIRTLDRTKRKQKR